ncbi:MAG: XRE family transcriptional regulator, partial [Cyanobacteria bacterium J06627_28]
MADKIFSEVVSGSENVFEDLGFEPEEALNLKVRADLMLDLRVHIQKHSWTQKEAAEF